MKNSDDRLAERLFVIQMERLADPGSAAIARAAAAAVTAAAIFRQQATTAVQAAAIFRQQATTAVQAAAAPQDEARVALAKALREAWIACTERTPTDWEHARDDTRRGYLAEADAALAWFKTHKPPFDEVREREAFERFARKAGMDTATRLRSPDVFVLSETQRAWLAWCERAGRWPS